MFASFMLLLTFFLVVSFVVQPLFKASPQQPETDDTDIHALNLRKKVVYKQIKEAELEYEIGNLSEEDFIRTKDQLKEEASRIITAIEKNSL